LGSLASIVNVAAPQFAFDLHIVKQAEGVSVSPVFVYLPVSFVFAFIVGNSSLSELGLNDISFCTSDLMKVE
jgi:hypothetical protein